MELHFFFNRNAYKLALSIFLFCLGNDLNSYNYKVNQSDLDLTNSLNSLSGSFMGLGGSRLLKFLC